MTARQSYTIGVIGGTGNLGAALARRWARAGHQIVIGSRDAGRARQAAQAMAGAPGVAVDGATNRDAASRAELVVVAVPFATQADVLAEIRDAVQGKIVVDTTVPLMPPKVMRVQLPEEGCAAVRARQLLGAQVRLVSAFHNVAADKLASDAEVEYDVLVFGDDKKARSVVVALAGDAGLRGLHAGALVNSAAAEALTSILIFLNRNYRVDGAGIRITGPLDMRAADQPG